MTAKKEYAPQEKEKSIPKVKEKEPIKKSTEITKAPKDMRPVNDFWVGCKGAFHMTGTSGKGIYSFSNIFYDTNWSFVDDLPVGGRSGSTYKEAGYQFYMFFSIDSGHGCPNDKFELLWSTDNVNFNFFDCTI